MFLPLLLDDTQTNALSVGFLVMIVPVYQGELCHPDIRGRVTALQQFMLGVGALIATAIGYGTYTSIDDSNSGQWRIPLGIQNLPAVILAALILFFPESPRWLIDHGREEEGLKTLAKLHANGDVNDTWVRAEFDQIQERLALEHEASAKSYSELFTDKSCFRRLWLAISVQVAAQMTGVSAIQYYSVAIYAKIGIQGDETLRYQMISSVIALVAQFLCMLFIDRTGRRWPLIGGNILNCITFIIATVLLASFPPGSNNGGGAAGWGFIVVTWIYNFSFSATCGPLSWIIPAEIFDMKTRAKGVSLATMMSFAFNTMIGQTTSVALDDKTGIGWRWYILFIVSLHDATVSLDSLLTIPRSATLPTQFTFGQSSPRLPTALLRRCDISLPKRPCLFLLWTQPSSPLVRTLSVVLRRQSRSKSLSTMTSLEDRSARCLNVQESF